MDIRIVLVGSDDGYSGYTRETARLLLLDSRSGKLLDSWDNLNSDIRSTVVYDAETDACYFTAKGGTFYSVQVADGKLSAADINEKMLQEALYTEKQPPVDLILRPSGEYRLSNFMIWQSAYAEFVFMDVLWPDFKEKDLDWAFEEYARRDRRFGGV